MPLTAMSLASVVALGAALCIAIRHVLGMTTNEQMLLVHARRVVAVMARVLVLGKWFATQITKQPTGSTDGSPSNHESSVSVVTVISTMPQMAGIFPTRTINVSQEALVSVLTRRVNRRYAWIAKLAGTPVVGATETFCEKRTIATIHRTDHAASGSLSAC